MAAISDKNYLQPLELFTNSVEILWDERSENKTDISKTLLIEINSLLKTLGEILSVLSTEDLTTFHQKFQKVTPILTGFSQDDDLWKQSVDQKDRLQQAIATINNITNVDAIPHEALRHSYFHGDALKYGLITLQEFELPPEKVPTPQTFAMNYASDLLNQQTVEDNCVLYLIRPSSSISSKPRQKVVTLSYKIGSGKVQHQRLFFQVGVDHRPWTTGDIRAFTLQSLIKQTLVKGEVKSMEGLAVPGREETKGYTRSRYVSF